MAAKKPSPLDELRIPIDRMWETLQVAPLTDEALEELVRLERSYRDRWLKADADKAQERAERKATKDQKEVYDDARD